MRNSSSRSPTSKESLSDKLTSRISYRNGKRSTRKRLSLTSETSNSTGASSNATPLSSDPLHIQGSSSLSNFHLPQQPLHYDGVAKPQTQTPTRKPSRRDKDEPVQASEIRRRRRKLSVSERTSSSRKFENQTLVNSSEQRQRASKEVTARIKASARELKASSLEGDSTKKAAIATINKRSSSSGRGRSRKSTSIKESTDSTTCTQRSSSVPSKLESQRASSKQPRNKGNNNAGTSFVQRDDAKKIALSRENSRGRRRPRKSTTSKTKTESVWTQRSSSVPSKKEAKTPSSTTTKKSATGRHDNSKSNSSRLSAFMESENSKKPKDEKDASEVRSAFTSLSRSRNRLKGKAGQAGLKRLSYHEGKSNRNRDSDRHHSSNSRLDTTKIKLEKNANEGNGISSDVNNSNNFGAGQQSLSLDTSNYHQYHQLGTGSLPALPEESKLSKKPKTKKTHSNEVKKTTMKNKGSTGISTQELSDFLEQCNARRKEQQEASTASASASMEDRSCVSMPAAGVKSRRSNSSKMSESFRRSVLATRRQQSHRSFQTSSSDPHPDPSKVVEVKQKRSNSKTSRRQQSRKNVADGSSEGPTRRDKVKKRSNEHENTRSTSASRKSRIAQKSQPNATKEIWSKSSKTKSFKHSDTGQNGSARTRRERAETFRKLFSIRDIPSNEEEEPLSDTLGEAPKTPTARFEARQGVNAEGLRQVAAAPPLSPQTPNSLPPLVPFTPSTSGRPKIRAIEEDTIPPPLPNSLPSVSLKATTSESDSHAAQQRDLHSAPKPHSSQASSSESRALPMWKTNGHATRNEANANNEKLSSAHNKSPVLVGPDEDVFTFYSWSKINNHTENFEAEGRDERQRMKESCRKSLLYFAFEAIEANL